MTEMNNASRKILRLIPAAAIIMSAFTACNKDDEDTWDTYSEWREANEAYYEEQQFSFTPEGKPAYETLTPVWNSSAQILIRYLNDRKLTEGNLSPLLTSTVDVKYIGRLYDGTPFDSSYLQTANGDSIFRTLPSSVIQGWTIALLNMRVGDSARIVVPYSLGYGATSSGSILPYSTLIFDMKLVDIPYYEVRP